MSHHRAPPWTLLLRDYLQPLKVVSDDNALAGVVANRTLEAIAALDLNAMMAVECKDRPDLMVRVDVKRKQIVLLLREDPAVLGGVIEGVPYMLPSYRGRGFGAELVCFSDLPKGFALRPALYSVSGLRSRVSAHRRHLERTLRMDPSVVPVHVRVEYAADVRRSA